MQAVDLHIAVTSPSSLQWVMGGGRIGERWTLDSLRKSRRLKRCGRAVPAISPSVLSVSSVVNPPFDTPPLA